MNRYLSYLSHLSFSSFPSLRKSVVRRVNHLSLSPVTRRTGRTDRTGRTKRTGNPDEQAWRYPCPTSLPALVVTGVVPNVRSTMGSARNIGASATTTTTGSVARIRTETTASTTARRGDDCGPRSCDKTRCAKRARRTTVSLRRTRSTTEFRSAKEEHRSIGTTCNHSADRVTRARARRKDRDGDACRGWGGVPPIATSAFVEAAR